MSIEPTLSLQIKKKIFQGLFANTFTVQYMYVCMMFVIVINETYIYFFCLAFLRSMAVWMGSFLKIP